MSEGIRPAQRPRKRGRLTTGHHTIDLWAGIAPIVLALLAFVAAWNFDTFSSIGIFLRILGFALALLALVILGLRVHVPNHRDYYGGLALIFLALIAFIAGGDLAGMRGFSFGAGTAPRLFASGLAIVAALITISGLVTKGEPVGGYAVRGPLLVTAAIIAFALLIRGFTFHFGETLVKVPAFGLIIASFATFMIAAMASKETRMLESLIVAAALTAFCVAVFVYLLGLPFQLWPRF
jgi:putative tricarboxylic transport membrane protein